VNDIFERRVHAAAIAGWWVLLIAGGLLTLSWFAYLAVMANHPDWLIRLWGPDMTWDYVEKVWFWAIAALKLVLWIFIMLVLWLTLWARHMRKQL
jgi:hypothetical protein